MTRKHFFLILIGLVTLLPTSVRAAVIESTQGSASLRLESEGATTDALVVPLSGKLRLTLTVVGPIVPREPYQPLRLSQEWEAKAEDPPTLSLMFGLPIWHQRFVLDPRGKIGPLTLQLEPLNAGATTVKWPPIPVEVTTQVARTDLKEIRDVRPPEELPVPPSSSWLCWLAGGLGFIALVGGLAGAWALRRRFRTRVPPLQPHEWALRELERIERSNLLASGDANRFHTLISEVVRRYLELRFQLPASQRTTGEFLQTVAQAEVTTEHQRQTLRELLEHCDLAKFAPFSPTAEESAAVLNQARSFVNNTRPQPEPGLKSSLVSPGP